MLPSMHFNCLPNFRLPQCILIICQIKISIWLKKLFSTTNLANNFLQAVKDSKFKKMENESLKKCSYMYWKPSADKVLKLFKVNLDFTQTISRCNQY